MLSTPSPLVGEGWGEGGSRGRPTCAVPRLLSSTRKKSSPVIPDPDRESSVLVFRSL